MDYATLDACGDAAPNVSDRPYLARISELADEANRIAGYLQAFIDRCRGGGTGEGKCGPVPVPSGHLGNIDRLTESLGRVDKLARELQTIG
jgi:hypothetical protein